MYSRPLLPIIVSLRGRCFDVITTTVDTNDWMRIVLSSVGGKAAAAVAAASSNGHRDALLDSPWSSQSSPSLPAVATLLPRMPDTVPGTASSRSRDWSRAGETYCSSSCVNCGSCFWIRRNTW